MYEYGNATMTWSGYVCVREGNDQEWKKNRKWVSVNKWQYTLLLMCTWCLNEQLNCYSAWVKLKFSLSMKIEIFFRIQIKLEQKNCWEKNQGKFVSAIPQRAANVRLRWENGTKTKGFANKSTDGIRDVDSVWCKNWAANVLLNDIWCTAFSCFVWFLF